MPRGSIPINPLCVKLQEQGWNCSDATEEDLIFRDNVRNLFYFINDPKQKDDERMEQLMLAMQFEITSGECNDKVILSNVKIYGKELPAKEEETKEKAKALVSGEAKYKFNCDMNPSVLGNFATIRLKLGSVKSIFCTIEETAEGTVYFNPYDPSQSINTRLSYDVEFMPNDLSICLGFAAIKKIQSLMLSDYFRDFDKAPMDHSMNSSFSSTTCDFDGWNSFEWINKNIQNNEEQKIAVQKIVECKARPFPFVVFGPPGTGKTTVLIEAVLQIIKRKFSSKILITAQSNSACNEICSRLIDQVPFGSLLRLFPRSTFTNEKDKIPDNILDVSSSLNTIAYEKFRNIRIIIATLVTSEQVKTKFRADYIFIDECASASEPEALIPITAFGARDSAIVANLILLGDHKQLGPVVNSTIAEKLGLGVSLMERIMSKPRYKAQPDFNNDFVVQLLDNYRSHPAILDFSNKQFYNSKLRPKMSEDDQHWALGWTHLANKAFPIMFHVVEDSSEVDSRGSSSNTTEAIVVRTYITYLIKEGISGFPVTAKEIGVVTPYTAQNRDLKDVLQNTGVEVGSTEYFQGREKEIMIMSTVRSQSSSIGFLNNPKRLNVMITRAKYLLIIIGNPKTLEMDPLWKELIDYCRSNNAMWDRSGSSPGYEPTSIKRDRVITLGDNLVIKRICR